MTKSDHVPPFEPPPSPRPGDLSAPADGYERAAPGSATGTHPQEEEESCSFEALVMRKCGHAERVLVSEIAVECEEEYAQSAAEILCPACFKAADLDAASSVDVEFFETLSDLRRLAGAANWTSEEFAELFREAGGISSRKELADRQYRRGREEGPSRRSFDSEFPIIGKCPNLLELVEAIAEDCASTLECLADEVEITSAGSDAERYAEMVCDEFTKLQAKGGCYWAYDRLIHFLEALLAEARERYDPTDAGENS